MYHKTADHLNRRMFHARDAGDWVAAFRYIDEALKYPECEYTISQMTSYVVHPKETWGKVNLEFGVSALPYAYKVNEEPLLVNIGTYAKFLASNWVLGDRLPIQSDSIDNIAIDPKRTPTSLAEACRILKPGGFLYCTSPVCIDTMSLFHVKDMYVYVKKDIPIDVDVIIPSKTSPSHRDMVVNCVDTLRRSETRFKFNVVVVESEQENPCPVGQDATIQWGKDKEFSYNGALALGIQSTNSSWVALSNNDVLFHPGWFTEIIRLHDLYPEMKSFSCWNGYNNWHPNRFPSPRGDFIVDDRICCGMAGWLLVVKRELLQCVNLSDRVSLSYSDNIYADELRRLGEPHVLAVHSKVDHLMSQTVGRIEYNDKDDYNKYMEGRV